MVLLLSKKSPCFPYHIECLTRELLVPCFYRGLDRRLNLGPWSIQHSKPALYY